MSGLGLVLVVAFAGRRWYDDLYQNLDDLEGRGWYTDLNYAAARLRSSPLRCVQRVSTVQQWCSCARVPRAPVAVGAAAVELQRRRAVAR